MLLISIVGVGQSQDRAKIEKEIETLREQLKQKEAEFLAPSAEDRAQFGEFLLQRDTGLARLLPRAKYQEKLTYRGGGAYYSFTRGSNSYDRDPQIGLEQESLFTGLPGAGFGFLTSLGDVPLEALTVDQPGVRYLAGFVAPVLEPDAREQQRRIGRGFLESGHHYRQLLPVVVNHTYVLRSIGYGRFDVLVAFRVVRKDTDESVTLLWKKLKEFPTPFLAREQ